MEELLKPMTLCLGEGSNAGTLPPATLVPMPSPPVAFGTGPQTARDAPPHDYAAPAAACGPAPDDGRQESGTATGTPAGCRTLDSWIAEALNHTIFCK